MEAIGRVNGESKRKRSRWVMGDGTRAMNIYTTEDGYVAVEA